LLIKSLEQTLNSFNESETRTEALWPSYSYIWWIWWICKQPDSCLNEHL